MVDKPESTCYNKGTKKREENKTMANIYNLPEYASEYPFIVASVDGEDLWFYGAYRSEAKAESVALSIEGVVVRN